MFLSEKLQNTLESHEMASKEFGIVGDLKHDLLVTAAKHTLDKVYGLRDPKSIVSVVKATDTEFRRFCREHGLGFEDHFFEGYIRPLSTKSLYVKSYFKL